MNHVLNNNMLAAVQSGGGLMIIAAIICFLFIKEKKLGKAMKLPLLKWKFLNNDQFNFSYEKIYFLFAVLNSCHKIFLLKDAEVYPSNWWVGMKMNKIS
jgi:hypothetical protein